MSAEEGRADVEELGRLLGEATPAGDWYWTPYGQCGKTLARPGPELGSVFGKPARGHEHNILKTTDDWAPTDADATLIAALVNAAPSLLAEVADLRRRLVEVEGERDEWYATAESTQAVNKTLLITVSRADRERKSAEADLADLRLTEAVLRGEIRRSESALATFDDVVADLAAARAEVAELREMRARVGELADEWSADEGRTWIASLGDDLRAALTRGEQP